MQNILAYYEETYGITEVGIFGFCWGGKVSAMASIELPGVKVAGLVHPSSVTNEMILEVKNPMYLFPCLDDPDMVISSL